MHAFGGTTLARKRKKYNRQMTGEVNSALDRDENTLVCLLLFLCSHIGAFDVFVVYVLFKTLF